MLIIVTTSCLAHSHLRLVWLLFFVFTFLHLFSNYRAVSVVSMETLNRNRLHLLMKHLFTNGEVPNPKLINLQEPLLLGKEHIHHLCDLKMSCLFENIHAHRPLANYMYTVPGAHEKSATLFSWAPDCTHMYFGFFYNFFQSQKDI